MIPEVHSEPCQTPKKERFSKIVMYIVHNTVLIAMLMESAIPQSC